MASSSALFAFSVCLFCVVFPFFSDCVSTLIQLDDDSWSQVLQGEWMIEFFAPWCPACKGLQPIWEDFASWSNDLGIRVAHVDVTTNPGLSGRFLVTALPTIYHIKDGHFRLYRGPREKDNFITFIEEKKWMALEEISSWKSPSSIQMSIVSYFFKLSILLRSTHNYLVEVYGLPYWGSFLLFGVVTVVIGAILGLLLVCCVDVVFPPKSIGVLSPPVSSQVPEQQPLLDSVNAEEEEEEEEDGSSSENLGTDENDKKRSSDSSPSSGVRRRRASVEGK